MCYRVPVEVCMRYLGEHPELLAEGWLLRNTEALHEYLDGTRKMKYD